MVSGTVVILALPGAVLGVIALVALIKLDRQKDKMENLRHNLRFYIAKATADRNSFARIPASMLADLLELDERTIPIVDLKPGKQHLHPAIRRP